MITKLSPSRHALRFLTLIILFQLPYITIYGQQEAPDPPAEEPPIVVVDGIPYLLVTIEDKVSEFDSWAAHTRERLLKNAFDKAIKRSGLLYAYTVSFQKQPRPEWVPELQLEVIEWRHSDTEAFVCAIDSYFIDATGERHNLKGAYGTEMTIDMSEHREDIEEHMEAAASKAVATILKRVKKKRLYRVP